MELATVAKSRHVDNYIKNQTCSSPASPVDPPSADRSVQITAKNEVNKKNYMKFQEKLSAKATAQNAIYFWQTLLSMYEVTQHIAMSKKERGMMKNLVSYLTDAGVNVASFLEFCVANWDKLRAELTWPDNPKKSRITSPYPFFQEIYFLKEDIIRIWEKHDEAEVKTISKRRITDVADIPTGISSEEYKRMKDQIEILGYAEVDE